jgi:prophage maintenance system killer protein
MANKRKLIIYQAKNGSLELQGDFNKETIWASLQQIADLFETDKSGISRHIRNIYKSGELDRFSTVAKNATVQNEGDRKIKREIEYFNLDLILSVGYRVNSKMATKFRQWATKTLRQHITKGYTINKKVLAKNYEDFLEAVEVVKNLAPSGSQFEMTDALDLVKLFASTWFSLEAYDKSSLPKSGLNKQQVRFTANELSVALGTLKKELIRKKEATNLFGQERQSESIQGIVGNIFQSLFGKDAYPTTEEKAAHLLYFIIKNHPFTDGNKRSGAFAFIWFLNRAKLLVPSKMSPEALTALTLLVAESKSHDKEQIVGLILLLLKNS